MIPPQVPDGPVFRFQAIPFPLSTLHQDGLRQRAEKIAAARAIFEKPRRSPTEMESCYGNLKQAEKELFRYEDELRQSIGEEMVRRTFLPTGNVVTGNLG